MSLISPRLIGTRSGKPYACFPLAEARLLVEVGLLATALFDRPGLALRALGQVLESNFTSHKGVMSGIVSRPNFVDRRS
jgi:hypothetical protein